MQPTYCDFLLTVSGSPSAYTIEADGPNAITIAPVPFVLEVPKTLQSEFARLDHGLPPSREHLAEIGTVLFTALFPRPIYGAWQRASAACAPSTYLRLKLYLRPAQLNRLPWELLYDPDEEIFLAARLSHPIVRHVEGQRASASLMTERPLRVLYVHANPKDTHTLNLKASEQALRDALGERGEVHGVYTTTPEELRDMLREPPGFHLLHYDGHATFDEQGNFGYLALHTHTDTTYRLSGEMLATYLDATSVRLLVLSACETGMDSTSQRLTGIAQQVMRTSTLPAVVAMQWAIQDRAAIAFTHGFYQALADEYPVDAATIEGRKAILELVGGHTSSNSEQGSLRDIYPTGTYPASLTTSAKTDPDWATPVLFMRTGDGALFQRNRISGSPAVVPQRTFASLWRRVGLLGVLIGVISSILGIVQFAMPYFSPQTKMTGDFNIAVAAFGKLDGRGGVVDSEEGRALAESVYRVLRDEVPNLLPGVDVQLLPPHDMSAITGATATHRSGRLQQVGEDILADIIVYGNLDVNNASFVPEFYLSPRKLGDAEELVGRYQFGPDITVGVDVATNTAARIELNERVRARAKMLVPFTIGLGYYSLRQFDEAATYFEQASAVPNFLEGREVVYLFQGNTAGKLNQLDDARTFYNRALDIQDEYGRARIGVAEVVFQQSKANCKRGTANIEGLNDSLRLYEHALKAKIQPELANVATKVAFGMGRVHLCLGEALSGTPDGAKEWSHATQYFERVITDFEAGDTRMQDLAAESHANLALVSWPFKDDPERTHKLEDVAEHYRKAIQLSQQPNRKAFFNSVLGNAYEELQSYDAADAAYSEAVQLEPDPTKRAVYERARQAARQARSSEQGTVPTPTPEG